MQLLDKLQYLRMLREGAEKVTPKPEATARVLEYATHVWPSLDLKKRILKTTDIVVTNDDHIEGHILIDLAAEYSEPFLNCPSFEFEGTPTPDDLKSLIPQIHPNDDNPFAILMLGDGTFMQTLRTDDGFVLEYQLVNTKCHFEIPERATAGQVVAAMVSYAFGKNEWLESFDWQLQELE